MLFSIVTTWACVCACVTVCVCVSARACLLACACDILPVPPRFPSLIARRLFNLSSHTKHCAAQTHTHTGGCQRGDDVNETLLKCDADAFVRDTEAPMLDPRQVDSFSSLGVCQDKEHTDTQWRHTRRWWKRHFFRSDLGWNDMLFCQFCPSNYHRLSLLCLICALRTLLILYFFVLLLFYIYRVPFFVVVVRQLASRQPWKCCDQGW